MTNKKSEKSTEEVKKELVLQYAKQMQSIVADSILNKNKTTFSTLFTKENVQTYLENPENYQDQLRKLSIVLTTISPQYQNIMFYYPAIAKICPVVFPNMSKYNTTKATANVDKVTKDYYKAINQLELMNIKHEFLKIISTCVREDVFYGYEYEDNTSYYIKPLDGGYCKISSVEDGCFNFAFDFSFFDKNKKINDMLEEDLVNYYPPEFLTKYNAYKKNAKLKWQELDSTKTICVKFLEDIPYAFPPYANLFNDLSDLVDYKSIKKTRTEIDNYKFIGLQIPTFDNNNGQVDDFKIDIDTAYAFYSSMIQGLPEGIGAFITPLEIKDIDFNSSQNSDNDQVSKSEDNLFTSAGLAPIVYGKGAENSGVLKYSTTYNSSLLFNLYRQLERWLNRKFKRNYGSRVLVQLLDITYFNENEFKEGLLQQAQYGLPVKASLASACGISPLMERGMSFLENEVLKLHDEWIPLSSSHTESGDNGKPENDESDLSESAQQTRDNDSNNKR